MSLEEREKKQSASLALRAEIAAAQTELDELQQKIDEYRRHNAKDDPWSELAFWKNKEEWEAANLPLDEIGDYTSIKRQEREEINRRERKRALLERVNALEAAYAKLQAEHT